MVKTLTKKVLFRWLGYHEKNGLSSGYTGPDSKELEEKRFILSAAEFTPRVTVSGKLRLRYSASDSLQLRKKRSFIET